MSAISETPLVPETARVEPAKVIMLSDGAVAGARRCACYADGANEVLPSDNLAHDHTGLCFCPACKAHNTAVLDAARANSNAPAGAAGRVNPRPFVSDVRAADDRVNLRPVSEFRAADARIGSAHRYQGRPIVIKAIGTGGPNGLMTDEGVRLPIGTVYSDTVLAGDFQATESGTTRL